LWPECSAPRALANLRTSLNDLRRALTTEACRLHSPTSRTLCLDLTDTETDVATFDACLARGDACSLAQAVGLYRGPLLEGCSEEWILEERRGREEACLGARARLAADAQAAGDLGVAEQHLRAMLAADPLREEACRSLMRVLAAGGSYAAALSAYRELRLLLHRELNAEPDPATRRLFDQIRTEARSKAVPGARCPVPGGERASRSALELPSSSLGTGHRAPGTGSAATPHNLPISLTRFIGREQQIADISGFLKHYRLVTLTGAGGCGKSRLALECAHQRIDAFPGGVWLVELAPLSDPALLPQTVATALDIREEPGQALQVTLVRALRERQLLIVLDNCEHVIDTCAGLVEALLQKCAYLRVLATSRERLGVAGERLYRVPSLTLPDASSGRPLEQTDQSEAIQLFVDRAHLVQPTFTLTEANAPSVVQVCRRLDGIPLAIELAAARVQTLSVETMAERLHESFHLVAGGSRTALPRHQTLRALIDWSYRLLSEAERALLRRLSVFAGGWTLEAAEAVCGEEVFDLLASLVEKSLVLYEERGADARYRLLETVRQYGRDRLLEAGESAATRARHRDWCLELAGRAEPELRGHDQVAWLDRLELEHENLHAALEWSKECGIEAGLRLASALWRFWVVRCYWEEGLQAAEELLALAGPDVDPRVRGWALIVAGHLAFRQQPIGWMERAISRLEESLALFEELQDREGTAYALVFLGWVLQDERQRASTLAEQSLALFRELGDTFGMAFSYWLLGSVEEWVAVSRQGGHKELLAWALHDLAMEAEKRGEAEEARALRTESLLLHRELGNKLPTMWGLLEEAERAFGQGNSDRAATLCGESLSLLREVWRPSGIAYALDILGRMAIALEQWERAARLLGAVERFEQTDCATSQPPERSCYESETAALRAALGEQAFAQTWAAGRAMTLEEAVVFALEPAGVCRDCKSSEATDPVP
jgi:non-specific serine/threonine protein kinase